MDRPEARNAFSEELQSSLTDAFAGVGEDVRVIVLTGAGPAFSAGADIAWMRSAADNGFEDNVADSRRFEGMLAAVDTCPVPVVARINGHALGGAVGLIACADVALAVDGALFGFSEVRLGIAPAMISHYAQRRIGVGNARRYFLTGERFDAARAQRLGLVSEVAADLAALDDLVDHVVDELLASAPGAQRATKALIATIASTPDPADTVDARVELIARLRVAEEGQDGLGAFFDKRRPSWHPDA
ncbi:enoyl-CoA hydratase/isomerase family protein [Nitriliruptoraceae bacterium ZYF776]|nr:enoyl-CoA hydratase/isomerase family protein [Profundirhabdus halotolerans]